MWNYLTTSVGCGTELVTFSFPTYFVISKIVVSISFETDLLELSRTTPKTFFKESEKTVHLCTGYIFMFDIGGL